MLLVLICYIMQPKLTVVFFFCVCVAKNIFRVSSTSRGQSHTLLVSDVYHKQQWLNCVRSAMAQQRGESVRTKRRSSSTSAKICDEEADENCPPVSGPKLRPQTLSRTRLGQTLPGPQRRKETGV